MARATRIAPLANMTHPATIAYKSAVVERDVPLPQKHWTTSFGEPISIRASIQKLKKGDSFRIDKHEWRTRVTAMASHLKIRVKTNRLEGDGLLVTRL